MRQESRCVHFSIVVNRRNSESGLLKIANKGTLEYQTEMQGEMVKVGLIEIGLPLISYHQCLFEYQGGFIVTGIINGYSGKNREGKKKEWLS